MTHPTRTLAMKLVRAAFFLLLTGLTLTAVASRLQAWLGPARDRRWDSEQWLYGHLRYRLLSVDVAVAGQQRPGVGAGVYLEERDLLGTWRLRKVGEVVRDDVNSLQLGLHPQDGAKLNQSSLEITCYQFDADFEKLAELVLSQNRRKAVLRELELLWDVSGESVKNELRDVLKGTMDAVDPAAKEAIEGVAIQEVLAGWLDQQRPSPAVAKQKAIESFVSEFLSKLVSNERLPELMQALHRTWGAIRSLAHDDPGRPQPEWVGIQDILERYLFLSQETDPPRKLRAFSPEVTLFIRGILYAPAPNLAGREQEPPERWIVLRQLDPSRPRRSLPAGALWSSPGAPM